MQSSSEENHCLQMCMSLAAGFHLFRTCNKITYSLLVLEQQFTSFFFASMNNTSKPCFLYARNCPCTLIPMNTSKIFYYFTVISLTNLFNTVKRVVCGKMSPCLLRIMLNDIIILANREYTRTIVYLLDVLSYRMLDFW